MRCVSTVVVVFLCLMCSLSACRKSIKSNGVVIGNPEKAVSKLLDEGKVDEAAQLAMVERDFFAASYGDSDVHKVVDQLARALSEKYSPELCQAAERAEAIQWPAPLGQWATVRNKLLQLHKELDVFIERPPFQYSIYRPRAYSDAVSALKAKENAIRLGAFKAFSAFPMESERSFFEVYPVPLDGGEVMRNTRDYWKSALVGFDREQSDNFFALYGKYLPKSAKSVLGNKYFDSLCPDPARADLKKILNAYHQVEAADMMLDRIPGLKVAFLQVTNPDLIRKKALDFPISIKVDVPFEASKASMRKMFTHKAVKEADIVVLVSIALARVERVSGQRDSVESTYVESYTNVENPEYAIAKVELDAAAAEFHSAQAEANYSWGARMVEKFIIRDDKTQRIEAAKMRMEELKDKMRDTPMYIKKPNVQPYSVVKAHMDINRYATVNYYVIDKRNRRYFRDTFDFKEKTFFTVHYGMHARDLNREQLLQTSVLEKDVARYELSPVVVKLSDLLEQSVNTPSAWHDYSSMMAIHRAVAADSEKAQKLFDKRHYEFDKYHDKRFDTVVQVRNLGNGLGAGFYVTDEFIITNYHVVGEDEYVRLMSFDRREFMGRVIARDAHLDLALIEADVKGSPVCFYDKHKIPLGVDLEIIGHPDGLQYSITRGALSSVRNYRPLMYGETPTKEDVLYLQTDAPVNGGNSGGPVFWGDYVVGVLDWGKLRTKDGRIAHGLNFAIHYSEIFKFFDRNDIEVCKGSK